MQLAGDCSCSRHREIYRDSRVEKRERKFLKVMGSNSGEELCLYLPLAACYIGSEAIHLEKKKFLCYHGLSRGACVKTEERMIA